MPDWAEARLDILAAGWISRSRTTWMRPRTTSYAPSSTRTFRTRSRTSARSQTEEAEGRVRRRTRCVLGIDMGAAGRFLGGSEPAWVEDATWHPEKSRWEW